MSGRALVTGSAGFIGRHMVAHLLTTGWDVTGVDIAPGRFGWQANMGDYLRHETSRYDLVVHAAAWTPHRAAIDSNPQMHLNNRLLDAQLFHWAAKTRQGRVLYFSSCAVLDKGELDGYAAGKLAGEHLAEAARAAGLPVTVVRPYSGYGTDQSEDFPFRAFVERAKRRENPFTIWGDGQQVRDWVHVDDVVAEAMVAVRSGTTDPMSICTGVGTSMQRLAELVCIRAGYSPEFRYTGTSAGADRRVGTPGIARPKIDIWAGVQRAFQ